MTTIEERAPLLFLTDTEREKLRADLLRAEELARQGTELLAGAARIIAGPPVDMLAEPARPSFHPERMGYMSDLDTGDRAMWDGSWHEVTVVTAHLDGDITIHANTAEALTSPGTYAIRIQKRAETGYPSDGPMPTGVTEVEPW